MPNFKSMSFKMAVLQGGGQNLPSSYVCYPKDSVGNKVLRLKFFKYSLFYAGFYGSNLESLIVEAVLSYK